MWFKLILGHVMLYHHSYKDSNNVDHYFKDGSIPLEIVILALFVIQPLWLQIVLVIQQLIHNVIQQCKLIHNVIHNANLFNKRLKKCYFNSF